VNSQITTRNFIPPGRMNDGAMKAKIGSGKAPAVLISTAVDRASKRSQKCCLTASDYQPSQDLGDHRR
jgi:hypothetical protein